MPSGGHVPPWCQRRSGEPCLWTSLQGITSESGGAEETCPQPHPSCPPRDFQGVSARPLKHAPLGAGPCPHSPSPGFPGSSSSRKPSLGGDDSLGDPGGATLGARTPIPSQGPRPEGGALSGNCRESWLHPWIYPRLPALGCIKALVGSIELTSPMYVHPGRAPSREQVTWATVRCVFVEVKVACREMPRL